MVETTTLVVAGRKMSVPRLFKRILQVALAVALTAAVPAFLLQHAIQGWCPPLPVFRRLGVRTADEINRERVALQNWKADRVTGDAVKPDS